MKHSEGFFKGVRGLGIYYQCWLPEEETKAVLLIVHGLTEHSGRYVNIVNRFVPLGYAVWGADLPGHGKSAGPRLYVKRFHDFTDSLHVCADAVLCEQPEKPVFLFGHSMGALIAAEYLLEHQKYFAGAVLSGPAVKTPDAISSSLIFTGRVLSVLMPRAGLIPVKAEDISRDPHVVQAYITDPLVHTGKITARLGVELLKAMKHLAAEAQNITLPVLILQGGSDRIVDPAGARRLYERAGSEDKEIKVYGGCYHEVFNDPEHAAVLEDVRAWLDRQLGINRSLSGAD